MVTVRNGSIFSLAFALASFSLGCDDGGEYSLPECYAVPGELELFVWPDTVESDCASNIVDALVSASDLSLVIPEGTPCAADSTEQYSDEIDAGCILFQTIKIHYGNQYGENVFVEDSFRLECGVDSCYATFSLDEVEP